MEKVLTLQATIFLLVAVGFMLKIIHLAVIAVLVLIFTEKSGIMGFAAAVLIANVIRVAAVILLGLWKAGSGPKQKKQ